MIRILLVDDHAVVRMGFRLLLQSVAEMSVIARLKPAKRLASYISSSNPTSWSWILRCPAWRSRGAAQDSGPPPSGAGADLVGAR